MYVRWVNRWRKRILKASQMEAILRDYDLILPQKKRFKHTVYEQYKRRHQEEDILLTRTILAGKYPAYLSSFDEVFSGKEMYAFNMFVMPRHLFDEYMSWLFDLLFELEKQASIRMDDKYQKRLCAFMAERLQTVWVHHKKLKVKELAIIYFKHMKQTHF